MDNIIAIIPARLHSTRFKRKILADIQGMPMIEFVFRKVVESDLFDDVIIAADNADVVSLLKSRKCNVVLTDENHICGTDRIAEVARNLDAAYIVNIQGDEPLISRNHLSPLVSKLNSGSSPIVTAISKISDRDLHINPNVVKCVTALDGNCLYFSRANIPFDRDSAGLGSHYFRHYGVYGFTKKTLLEIVELPPSPLENIEKLEQLRWLEHGYQIHSVEINDGLFSVDTPEDLDHVRRILEK